MAKGFEDLEIWKKAHELSVKIYDLTSNKWPKSEIFGLISQIRRAAVSVELNIAEGQARYHYNETIHFLHDARASAQEVRNCLMLARDIKEISLELEEFEYFDVEYIGLIKGINGFVSYLRSKKSS